MYIYDLGTRRLLCRERVEQLARWYEPSRRTEARRRTGGHVRLHTLLRPAYRHTAPTGN
jgi:hypothetical protein